MSDNRPIPSDINSNTGLVNVGPYPSKAPVGAFQRDATENLIETKGFRAVHYRHALNPGADSLEAGEWLDTGKSFSMRSVVFWEARNILVIPQGFRLEDRLNVQGIYGIGSLILNLSGYYLDGDRGTTHYSPRDLIVIQDGWTDISREVIQYNPSGINRLKNRAVGVAAMFDGRGRKFVQDQDFVIQKGEIVWTVSDRPKMIDGRGDLISVVYWYRPYLVITSVPHEIRMLPANALGYGGQPRVATLFPQNVIAKPSTLVQEWDILDSLEMPSVAEYPTSGNLTGGGR